MKPILAGTSRPKPRPNPRNWSRIDERYRTLCADMRALFEELHIAAEGTIFCRSRARKRLDAFRPVARRGQFLAPALLPRLPQS